MDVMSQRLNLHGVKALVADDDPGVRAVLGKTLVEWGADVVCVESGPKAIAELTRARDARRGFLLIFLDSTMSPMDGFEVADRLKAHPREFERTIVMIGPEQITHEIGRVRALGAGSYVVKPLTRPAILGAIAAVMTFEASAESAQEVTPKRRFRILLAEDSPDIGFLVRRLVEGPEYQVDVAPDGGVAADLFRMEPYDLVLMDLQMPTFDGYWATREIRNWEWKNHLKRTPMIAVTAFAHQEHPEESFRAGLDGYLVKPLDREVLLRVIARHLAQSPRPSTAAPAHS